ncbi:Alkanesulfonate monooxygenase [bacterium HR23]|nr:Alkanesulfonate monooxygenase [bacterium HR23]
MSGVEVRFGSVLGREGAGLAEEARWLERLGYDYLAHGEHFMRGHPPGPSLLALPALAVAAGATRNIRLVSSIVLAPLYHPVMLAKLATTVDVCSGGRLVLGVGIGGEFPVEFDALGVQVKERGARTDELLPLLKRLWTEEGVSHRGRFYALSQVTLKPSPIQRPHPPLWVAGRREGAMRRAVLYGDGWFPYFYSPERYRQSVVRITQLAQGVGRDLSGFRWALYAFLALGESREEAGRVAAEALGGRYRYGGDFLTIVGPYCILGTPRECIRRIEEYSDAGVREFIFSWACPPSEARRHMEVTAKEIIPYFRG